MEKEETQFNLIGRKPGPAKIKISAAVQVAVSYEFMYKKCIMFKTALRKTLNIVQRFYLQLEKRR
jgi:hypothetical protein